MWQLLYDLEFIVYYFMKKFKLIFCAPIRCRIHVSANYFTLLVLTHKHLTFNIQH